MPERALPGDIRDAGPADHVRVQSTGHGRCTGSKSSDRSAYASFGSLVSFEPTRRTSRRRCLPGNRTFLLSARADHQHDTRAAAGTDDDVAGAGRTMEIVPLAEGPLLLLYDEEALAGEHEEPLLRVLVVIERVRIAGPQDAHVDADVANGASRGSSG